MRPFIIGTAGHIDHGKSALVKAVTGTDPDRLKEEQLRGITIELGYAFLTEQIAIIDVPGHERFIKHMVAGVATVDFACLVVAADDGIMPQTREHFDILRLLNVKNGIVAITKCDLAEEDWIDLVEDDICALVRGSFLDDRPIVRVDSLSGRGVEDLRAALLELASAKQEQPPGAFFRLPIDRVFTVKGFGTVVTGSALSGNIAVEDKVELLPKGLTVRVRGIQSQGKTAKSATGSMRLALNLSQLAVDDISRGDVLATPGRLKPTFMLDAKCRVLENSPSELVQRQRIRFHIGTKEIMARVVILDHETLAPGEEGLVQFRLEERTTAQRLDRFVVRQYSPQITLGGGIVLDANPKKFRKRHSEETISTLHLFGDAKTEGLVQKIIKQSTVLTFEDVVTKTGLSTEAVEEVVATQCVQGELIEVEAKGARHICAMDVYRTFEADLTDSLKQYHAKHPLRPGVKRDEILLKWKKRLPEFILKHFVEIALSAQTIISPAADLIALFGFEVRLTKAQRKALDEIEAALLKGGFQTPGIRDFATMLLTDEKKARQMVQILVDQGKVINLEGKIYFHVNNVKQGIEKLRAGFKDKGELTMSDFRVIMSTSRKYALPLCSYYDSQHITVRKGDVRIPGPKLTD